MAAEATNVIINRTDVTTTQQTTLVGFINDSDVFDEPESSNAFDIFMEKIADGSLSRFVKPSDQITQNIMWFPIASTHRKMDISPGTVFMGSSNFTYRGLLGQGELNDSFRDKQRFDEYAKRFAASWEDSRLNRNHGLCDKRQISR